MKAIKWLLVTCVALSVVACSKSSEGDEAQHEGEEVTKFTPCMDSESLLFWLQKKDSANHQLMCVADIVYQYVDSTVQDNLDSMLVRQVPVERKLIHAYDSICGKDSLPVDEKADSVISMLTAFLEDDMDGSTAGIVVNNGVFFTFYRYRIAQYYNRILKQAPYFREEIESWWKLEDLLIKYGLAMNGLEYYGGTMRSVENAFTVTGISRIRCEDLQDICATLKEEWPSSALFPNVALKLLQNTLDEAYDRVDVEEQKKYGTFDDGYIKLYKEANQIRKELKVALNEWLEKRRAIKEKAADVIYLSFGIESCTTNVMEKLAKTFTFSMH